MTILTTQEPSNARSAPYALPHSADAPTGRHDDPMGNPIRPTQNDERPGGAGRSKKAKLTTDPAIINVVAKPSNSLPSSCDGIMLDYSTFASKTHSRIDRRRETWRSAVEWMNRPRDPKRNKLDLAMFMGAKLGNKRTATKNGPGLLRNRDNVLALSMVIVDYDGEQMGLDEVCKRAVGAGAECLILTSASYTEDKPRWRAVLPLSAPIAPEQYAELVAKANGIFGGVLARESGEFSRAYFIGPVVGHKYEVRHIKGRALDLVEGIEPIYFDRSTAGKVATTVPTASASAVGAADPDDFMTGAAPPMSPEILADMLSAAMFLVQKGGIAEYQAWMRLCLILKSAAHGEFAEPLRLLWHEVSATDTRYDHDQAEHKWQSCTPTRIKPPSLFGWAQESGWANPRSKPTVEALVAGIADLKSSGHSPEQIVHQTIERLMLAQLGSVGDELVLKGVRVATDVSLKSLRESLSSARSRGPEAGVAVVSADWPVATAAALVEQQFTRDGMLKLIRLNGDFYLWRGTHFEVIGDEEIRARIYALFKAAGEDLSSRAPVDNTLDALKAAVLVPSSMTSPCWIGDDADQERPTDLIPLQNGLLCPHTRELIPHTPAFFNLHAGDVAYDRYAPEPVEWLSFLESVWPGDTESPRLLKQWFGYCLTTDTSQQTALMGVGVKRSGKGTIVRTQTRLVGSHAVAAPSLGQLGQHFGLQSLIGCNLMTITDARVGGQTDVQAAAESILRMTGEDAMNIPRKNRTDWVGRLTTKVMVMSNTLPAILDAGGAVASRFRVLRFGESFYGREDTQLEQKLEREMPGILNWALDGLDDLRGVGAFIQPQSGMQAVADLRRKTTPLIGFIEDELTFVPEAWTRKDDLHQAYLGWCMKEGHKFTLARNNFFQELYALSDGRMASFEKRNSRRLVQAVRGVSLKKRSC